MNVNVDIFKQKILESLKIENKESRVRESIQKYEDALEELSTAKQDYIDYCEDYFRKGTIIILNRNSYEYVVEEFTKPTSELGFGAHPVYCTLNANSEKHGKINLILNADTLERIYTIQSRNGNDL